MLSVGLVLVGCVVWVHGSWILIEILDIMLMKAERWSTVEVHFKATPGVCKFLAQHLMTLRSMSSCDTSGIVIVVSLGRVVDG